MPIYSIAEAKNHFPQLIQKVEQESVIHLTRHDKKVAVIVSIQKYQQLNRKNRDFSEVLDELFKQNITIENTRLFDQDRTVVMDRTLEF